MAKLYKILVFFVGLIVMNLNVHAQLGAISPYLANSKVNNDVLIAESYRAFGLLQDVQGLAGETAFEVSKEATDFKNYPNPAVTYTNIAYNLTTKANVNLRVIDLAGKQLCILVKQEQSAGKQEYYWELAKNNITSGMYILILQVDNKIYSRKIIVQ